MRPKLIKINYLNHNNLSSYSLDLKKIHILFNKLLSIKLIRNNIMGNIIK